QVTACDGFTALAKVADEVVRSAGLERNICVVHKMSSALDEEEIGSIDLIVAEILDSTLLGEGYLSTLRDLYTRGLVDATTHVIPRRARVWAQLVECPELQS
ncbi:protein arginine n-methyltransferase 7, partial [Nannochloropsis gaditana CCMP526]